MNVLPVIVSDPDELLASAAFGAGSLVLVESATAEDGTYAQIGTVAILASTYEYTFYDTTGPTGQWYRTRYSNALGTNHSDYGTARQAPTVTGLCSVYDVRSRLTGDNPNDGGQFNQVIAGKILEVTADINRMVGRARGMGDSWSFVADTSASLRAFTGFAGGARLLPVDDCVSVTSVVLYSTPGVLSKTLVLDTDYVLAPIQGTPITGITSLFGYWPSNAAGVGVTARWGYATSVPYDAREAAIIEVIRAFNADRSGNNDAVGVTPFGTAQFSKAYASKTSRLVADYTHGGGFLR